MLLKLRFGTVRFRVSTYYKTLTKLKNLMPWPCKKRTPFYFLLLVVLSSCEANNASNTTSESTSFPITADNSNNSTSSTATVVPIAPGTPLAFPVSGNEISVGDETELVNAIINAKAGDVITLVNGLYTLGNTMRLDAQGTVASPIIIRAENTRQAKISFSRSEGVVEGFVVSGEHWIIDGLVLNSDCTSDQHRNCEHALHVKGGADGLWVRNNQIVDFNAAIKGSGSDNNYADNVRIEHNEIFNTSVRMTSNPVTPIDINGGDGWVIYKNRISDFSKGMGNKVSYGAFLKANSSNGLFDSNWVQCEKHVFDSGSRVGLSFGGGGNEPIDSPICTDSDCSRLHRKGRMTNNLITNCSDVGIYVNKSADILLDHNTLYQTAGIDVRYETSTASIVANLMVGGEIRERNSGRVSQNNANTINNADSISALRQLLGIISPHSLTEPNPNFDICGYQREEPFVGAIGGTVEVQEACLAFF